MSEETGYEIDRFENVLAEHKPKNKKLKHNYTSELELKSLLIRIKNEREGITDQSKNKKINKYIRWFVKINDMKYDDNTKRIRIKRKLKELIVSLSEVTAIDKKSFERFGFVILLMVKNILKKPQFSGYTYKDDFYSDAVYKILKYLGNFNHKLISERTGVAVNSFAYITQIIHNSVLHIIITKKKENEKLKQKVAMENLTNNLYINNHELIEETLYNEVEVTANILTIKVDKIETNIVDELKKIQNKISDDYMIEFVYPVDYRISFDEYAEIKELLHGKISVIREDEVNE